MKKRLLTIATCIMFGSLCAFGLSACGDKHEHSYTSVVTNPTCTEQGYTTHTCDCGESYVDTYVEALGHSFTNYVVDANSATYEADGTKTAKCDRCDVTDTITDVGSRLKGTITLVYGNGQQNKVITEYKGTAIPAEADPVREGYTFTGWSTAIPATMGEGSTTITAGWAINQYTITLVYGNGTANKEIKQDYGTAIGAQADPTKTGYTFAGWNKEIPATMPAENLEITAQWNINQYSIIIVLGNGEENVEIKKDYNAQITETLPATLNRTGYTFAGWDKEMPATMPVDGLTITANWTINQYEMKFVLGNGEEDVVIKKDYNSAFTAPVPEKEGYTFAGWSATVPETIPAEDLTFTAQWTINQYSIIIVLDNGEENVEIKKDYNAEITETLPADLEKTGYTFAGWDKELPATMPVDGLTITAKWTINQYTITIVYGNGDPNGEITQDYNSAITTVLEAPVRNNYVFKGWDKELPATMPVDGLTITAIWTIDVSGDPIAIEQAYVSDEDDTVVVDSLGDYNASSFAEMMIGETMIDKTDYSVVDNKLVLAQNLIDEYLGTYQVVYVIDNLDNLIKVDVLFVNKVLKNAQDVEDAFDYGDQKHGDNFAKNTNSYVLAGDIDMTDVVINNRMIAPGQSFDVYTGDATSGYTYSSTTSTAADVGFAGIFDGRGYSISNVTVEMINLSLGQPIVDANGSLAWKNAQAMGFFANVLEGAQIKNVAFLNVYGKGAVSNGFGLNGLLGVTCFGTVENVLFDASINNIHARGPFAQYGATTVLKNVVVNYPKADYTIESHLDSAKKPAGGYYDTYAYGYGALSGHSSPMARYAKYENVFVASPMPINLYKAAGSGYAGITSVTYAENETDLRVLFDYEEGTTIAEAIEAEKEIIEQNKKTYQVAGVRRYDDLALMAQDTEYVQTLIDTGLFKIAEGKLLWHSQKIAVEVTEAVDFDAAEGKLVTSVLDGQNIVSANVNGAEVQYVDGKLVGVPELNNLNSLDQRFVITVETDEKAYTFTNVTYWASIINDQNELKAALDYDYSVDNKNNFAFLKLGNPIDIDKATWTEIDYTDLKNAARSTQKPDTPASGWNGVAVTTGFAGVFDGCGYAINFNATGVSGFGIFGALATGAQVGIKRPATIKNVAFLEYSKNWSPVIAQYGTTHTYNKGVLIENVYVTWLKSAVQAGLIYEPNAGNVIRNVMVNVENNVEFGRPVAEGKLENMSAGYYGGTLYSNLRRAGYILNLTDNFVSLGKGELAKQSNGIATTQYEKWFKTTGDATNGYVHTVKNGGWSGNTFNPELYLAYASNQEYGDTTINKGMKDEFAAIASKYANGATIAGYYCATCGETFSLTAGNCDKCEGEVALTESANLWREAISYNWAYTKLSEVNNANASSTGEVVLAGAYKYDTTAEMKASGNTFASFVGEAGNKMWAVNDGVLTWVGAQA